MIHRRAAASTITEHFTQSNRGDINTINIIITWKPIKITQLPKKL